ncbi:MAG TPA: AI-2E family transporter YdiK [Azospira sp.]|nr:AI-2E family transporter YdiK [Plasticicumulans sp.]HNJ77178.1 AI-2E family transporter YdiK [Azospira sp.]HNN09259.1 AI-2E family transporter YdiK [Azospira sp.]
MNDIRHDLTRTVLAVACIAGLVGASFWILRPFLGATIWAAMLVVATWPLFLRLERMLGARRGLAVTLMTGALMLLLVVPMWAAIDTIADNSGRIAGWVKALAEQGLPTPPDFVARIPFVGEKLASVWGELAAAGPESLVGRLAPYASGMGKWVVAEAGSVGFVFVQFLLVVALSAVMYANGEVASAKIRRFGRRLAGDRGENAVILAGQAIRGVAMGVGVTAIVQTTLGGVGLAVAGVPFAGFLAALMLMFCIAQLGPGLILFPAVGWLYWSGDSTWATVLLVWSLFVTTLDNFLRPFLIKQGADLPLLLIFAGVIGGMLGFGLIGLFIGPVVLAVTYTLLEAWIADALGAEDEAEDSDPA